MSTGDMMIGALAPWAGSKRTLCPLIVDALGPHNIFWDIFCGSMALLLGKPPCRSEVVNDLHGDLINLARCLQDYRLGPALYRRLRRVLCSEELFHESREALRARPEAAVADSPDVERAFHYFVQSWQGMSGFAGSTSSDTNFAKRYTSTGGDPAVRWRRAVMSIPAFRRRLEGVVVLRCDGIDLAEKIEDRDGTVIYADPPYLKKGIRYLHDFTPAHHARLAKALRRFKHTRVVVSYYEHGDLTTLCPGWFVRRVDATKGLGNQSKRDRKGAVAAPEVLLCNMPFADSGSEGFLFA
jgi:DNA adenine methylase